MMSEVTTKNINYHTAFRRSYCKITLNHISNFKMRILIINGVANYSCLIFQMSITRFSTLEKFLVSAKESILAILTLLHVRNIRRNTNLHTPPGRG